MIQLCSVTYFCVILTGPSASLGPYFPQVKCSPALKGAVLSDCQKWWWWGQRDPSQRQNGANLYLQHDWHGEKILFVVPDKVQPPTSSLQQYCQGRAKASRRKAAFHFSICHRVPPEQYKTPSDTYSAHFLALLSPVLSLLPSKLYCDYINTSTTAYSPFA